MKMILSLIATLALAAMFLASGVIDSGLKGLAKTNRLASDIARAGAKAAKAISYIW